MSGQEHTRIEVHQHFEIGLPQLNHEQRLVLARAIDRLGGGDPPPKVERVGGTRRLYRLRVGAWRVLFVRAPDRILLLSLEGDG
jgi:mRNA-degrading endonuclease RelE of RelBE toxin-antitoxin system